MAALGSQSIATSYEQLLHVDRDGGGNGATAVSVKDGDNGTTFCISMTDASTGKAVLAVDGSHADGTEVQIDNSAGDGDAFLSFQLSGTSKFTMGVDDGDSDKFKIGTTAIGTGTMFALDANSRISLGNNDGGNTGNTIFGKSAWNNSSNNDSDYNTIVGEGVMGTGAVDGAYSCTVVGANALKSVTTGSRNTAIGNNSATLLTTAWDTVFIGENAGAGVLVTGGSVPSYADGAVGIGRNALAALTYGANNVAVGYNASAAITSGAGNTTLGSSAGVLIVDGANNCCLGKDAGNAITSGSTNTCIGSGSDAAATVNNQIAIGNGAVTDGVNKGRWGNSSVATNNIQADWTVDSDIRIKKDIENSDIGLSFVNALKTRKYKKRHPSEYDAEILEARYKKGGANYDDDKDAIIKDEFDDNKVLNGLIAQEVKAVMDDLDVEFSGWSEDTKGKQGIQYSTLVVPLIKAIQELSVKVTALENA